MKCSLGISNFLEEISAAAAVANLLQSCPTLCDPRDGSPLGSPIPGILQARTLEGVAISFSRGNSWPRDWTQVSRIVGRHLTIWATREAQNTQKNYTKNKHLNDPDNHDGLITHLEPDILECKVKWALGSITMNKASGGGGIPVELFQILKGDAG